MNSLLLKIHNSGHTKADYRASSQVEFHCRAGTIGLYALRWPSEIILCAVFRWSGTAASRGVMPVIDLSTAASDENAKHHSVAIAPPGLTGRGGFTDLCIYTKK
jgi:hypothetical protein